MKPHTLILATIGTLLLAAEKAVGWWIFINIAKITLTCLR